MAPRANWKGFLRLSLVTCPVALYPATSDSEKISFNQINKKTGHRIRYMRLDADTGEEVANEDIAKGYPVDRDTYIEVTKEELENIELESTRTIGIDEFVAKDQIDPRYIIRPYYLVPDGKVGHDAFAVIRETIRNMNMVAIGRVVLTSREHIIGLEPLDKGLMGMLLRYPYEVRNEHEYFDDIQDVTVTKEMLDLARHIVNQKSGEFEPEKFEDHYEQALTDLINAKRSGKVIGPRPQPRADNVVNLMDALRQSIAGDTAKKPKKPRKAAAGKRKCFCPSKESAEPKRRPQNQSAPLAAERLAKLESLLENKSSVGRPNILASTLPKLGNSNTPSRGWSPVNVKGSIRKTPRWGRLRGFSKAERAACRRHLISSLFSL